MKKILHKAATLFLTACCAISLCSTMGIRAADIGFVIIDDTDTAFAYSQGGANDGGWDSYGSGDPSVTEHWANIPGANVTISFEGTKFELYGKKAPNHSMFSVSIDEQEATVHDAYAASATGNDELLFASDELENKAHTATITVLDKHNENAVNVLGMNVAYAKAYGPQYPVEEEKLYTDVDDALETSSGELFKIQYEPASRWNAESGYANLFYEGTDHYSKSGEGSENDYYTMNFIGTGLEIYASKNTGHANFDVYIDDVKVGSGNANLESGSTQHRQKLFEISGLSDEAHVLKVVKSADATATKAMQIDRIRVYHNEIAPQSVQLSKSEVTLAPGGSTKITASFEPWAVTNSDLRWESSDPDLVQVENGVISANETETRQEAVVTAVSLADESVRATVKVTVDPTLAVMNAYVGDEKILDMGKDYESLIGGSNSVYSATAWKGDTLSSKVIVASMSKDIHQAEVTASDFTSASGQVLHKENISIKWLKEVDANDGRNMAGEVKSFPDIIYKGGAKDIAANDVQFAWITIDVPTDTAAGVYTGTISVTADELKKPIELTYTIEVLNLQQPEPEATEIQIWQHPFSVANYYLGLGSQPSGGISYDQAEDFYFTEEHFDLMRASTKEYAEMGGHDVVANIVEEAWGHQSYYSDPSMVKWTKKADGSWEFDYTWYDAWINFMIECGVIDPQAGIGQIKCYSIVPWSNQITYYDEAQGKTVSERHNPGEASWEEMWKPFLQDFMEHSKEKGWFEITYISMDERGLDQLRPAVDLIEKVSDEEGNHFKISSALNYAAPQYYGFTDRIDDISINLGNASDVAQMKELSDHRRALGLNTTYYTCTGDYPSNFMISDPGDNYWTVWYTKTLGTDGYMRWAWDNYVYDMFGDASYRYWEPGDGWYIYPQERKELEASGSYEAGFYSTPRYEMFKQGIRDVAKAKYLLSCDEVSQEQKDMLKETVENLARPARSTHNGSAVAANEEQRMLVHSETERALEMTNEVARTLSQASEKAEALEQLNAWIAKAEKIDAEGYTEESYARLQDTLAQAKTAANDESATAADLLAAASQLENAINMLEKALDYSALLEAIEKAEQMAAHLDAYIPSSVADFGDKLAQAKQTVENAQNQQEIDDACEMLEKAMADAKKKADKSELQDAVDQAEDIRPENYEDSSAAKFKEALTAAKQVLADEEATQQEVDDALAALNQAMEGLSEKASGEESKDPVDTAAASYSPLAMSFAAAALGALWILRKKRQHDC